MNHFLGANVDVTDEPVSEFRIVDPAGVGVPPSLNPAFYQVHWNLPTSGEPVKRPSTIDHLSPFSAFTALGNLYTKNGGVISIQDVRIDSNTGRILYTLNGDTRDITDTLTSDERTVLQQSAPSHQFNAP